MSSDEEIPDESVAMPSTIDALTVNTNKNILLRSFAAQNNANHHLSSSVECSLNFVESGRSIQSCHSNRTSVAALPRTLKIPSLRDLVVQSTTSKTGLAQKVVTSLKIKSMAMNSAGTS